MRSVAITLAICGVATIALHSASAVAAEPAADKPRTIRIALATGPKGEIAEMRLDGKLIEPSKDGKQTRWNVLNTKIVEIVIDATGNRRLGDFAAEIDLDDKLLFENIINTVEAVSIYRLKPDGDQRPLVNKVKFAPRE